VLAADDPAASATPLPPGWHEEYSEEGYPFYYNEALHVSQWKRPVPPYEPGVKPANWVCDDDGCEINEDYVQDRLDNQRPGRVTTRGNLRPGRATGSEGIAPATRSVLVPNVKLNG